MDCLTEGFDAHFILNSDDSLELIARTKQFGLIMENESDEVNKTEKVKLIHRSEND